MVSLLARLPLLVSLIAMGGLAMLVPAIHAAATGEREIAEVFFWFAALTLVGGMLIGIAMAGRTRGDHPRRHLAGLLVFFAAMPLLLALPFHEAVGNTSFFNAYFEMVSCLTTTGATLYEEAGRLAPPLHTWRATVGWLGGLVIWVGAIAVLAPMALGGFEVFGGAQRIDRFLSPELSHWLTEAPRHARRAVRFVVRSLERATGRRTFSELRSFFAAFDELRSDVQRRARTARSLLSAPGTAFLLVTTPTPQSLTESGALRGALDELGIRLAGVIENRAHALPGSIEPGGAEARAESLLAELGESEASAWLRRAHADALARARDERALWQKLRNELPPGVEHATVAELSRDMCALADLRNVAERLWS